jgi:hypothetical protein
MVAPVIAVLVIAFLMVWAGVTLIIDGSLRRRRRLDLVERLRPFQPSIADGAEVWLRRQ